MSQRFNSVALKQSVVSLTAATDAPLVAANPLRKYLALQNIGAGDATLAFDVAAVAGQGFLLAAGATLTFESTGMPINSIHAISTPGSTVVVVEGV